jgi:hypothetical protein
MAGDKAIVKAIRVEQQAEKKEVRLTASRLSVPSKRPFQTKNTA